jgi:hypothetical protein
MRRSLKKIKEASERRSLSALGGGKAALVHEWRIGKALCGGRAPKLRCQSMNLAVRYGSEVLMLYNAEY